MSLEVFHISQGIDANARSDDADDEHHDDGEQIGVEADLDLHLACEAELDHHHDDDLDDGQQRRPDVFVLR